MKAYLASIFALASFGCSSPTASGELEATEVKAVVEEFNPNTLVIYGTDSPLPYDAASRTSKIRVMSPNKLVNRVYTIDLLQDDDKDGYKEEALKTIGHTLTIQIPKNLIQNKENEMLPIYRLTIEPNKSVDSTPVSAPR